MQHLDDGILQAWLDRERSGLSEAEGRALAEHLEGCPECAARADELEDLTRRTAGLLAGRARDEPLPAYREVVGRARTLRGAGRGRRWTVSAWAASIAVALGAGWMGNELYRGGTAPLVTAPRDAVEVEVARPSMDAGADEQRGRRAESGREDRQGAGVEARETVVANEAAAAPANRPPEPPAAASSPDAPTSGTATEPVPPASAPAADAPASVASAAPQAAAEATPDTTRAPVVHGRVVDAQTGQPIPAAQVYVADLDVGVLTLQDGSFRLPLLEEDVDEGPLTLTVQRIGYRPENREFSANPGDSVLLDFQIQEEALQLDEIIVTGTPAGTQRRALGNSVARLTVNAVSAEDPALLGADGWTGATADHAASILGSPPRSVDGLEVIRYEVGEVAGVDAVRVRQVLGPDAVLTMIQSNRLWTLVGEAAPDGLSVALRQHEGVTIVGVAPVPLDSLDALLAQVR